MNDKVIKRKKSSSDLFIGEVETSIGKLSVFSYRVKHAMALERLMGGTSIFDTGPEHFVRMLIGITCNHSEDVVDKQEPEATLAQDDINALTENDLDVFTELFIQDADYLVKETITHKRSEGDKEVTSIEWGDDVTEQKEGERLYEFLHRLFVIDEEKTEAQRKKFRDSLGLPSSLMDQFEHATRLGSVMSEQLKAIQPITSVGSAFKPINDTHASILKHASVAREIVEPFEHTTVVESPKLSSVGSTKNWFAEDQIKPIENLGEKIQAKHEAEKQRAERTIELTEQAVEHSNEQLKVMNVMAEQMVNLNQNQLVAAEDSAQSSISSEKIARRGLAINWAVLILTVCGLAITAFSTYMSYSDSKVDSDTVKENMDLRAEIVSKSEEINALKAQSQKVTELEEKLLELQLQLDQKDEPSINLIKESNNQSVENS